VYIPEMKKIPIPGLDALSPLVCEHLSRVAVAHDGLIRIGLAGGRSAAPIIQGLLCATPEILKRVRLYLVDERLSGGKNEDTLLNVGLQSAFSSGIVTKEQLVIPALDQSFVENDNMLDLLYLGVGEDGHVASLFPGSYPALDAMDTPDVSRIDNSPKPPPDRLTVTYRGFRRVAKQAKTYLLFLGEGKRNALERLLSAKENPSTLPCGFFPNEWFVVDIITDLKEIY